MHKKLGIVVGIALLGTAGYLTYQQGGLPFGSFTGAVTNQPNQWFIECNGDGTGGQCRYGNGYNSDSAVFPPTTQGGSDCNASITGQCVKWCCNASTGDCDYNCAEGNADQAYCSEYLCEQTASSEGGVTGGDGAVDDPDGPAVSCEDQCEEQCEFWPTVTYDSGCYNPCMAQCEGTESSSEPSGSEEEEDDTSSTGPECPQPTSWGCNYTTYFDPNVTNDDQYINNSCGADQTMSEVQCTCLCEEGSSGPETTCTHYFDCVDDSSFQSSGN